MRRLLAVLAGALVAVAACAPTGQPAASPTGVPRGGSLTFALWQEPETLNPFYSTQTASDLVSEIAVEGLVAPDPDGVYVPRLAKEVPSLQNGGVRLSPDGKRMDVTYRLVPSVLWSDGKPFTSADVKFTWETIMRDQKVSTREGYDKIESIDTPDDLTAIVHYSQIYAPFASRFQALLPKHLLEGAADVSRTDYVRRPLGTGPFRITEFVGGDHITAERSPNYRVKDRPILDRIIFKIVPARDVALAQLKAGEIDGMWLLLEAQVPELERDPNIKVLSVPAARLERIEFNLAKPGNPADPKIPHPVLGDLAVRRALLLATPKQQIIDKLLFGQAKPGRTLISAGWASPKDVDQEGYDQAKAKRVLDEAGWLPGADGVRSKAGVRASLRLSTTSGEKVREQIEQILVDEWKAIGIEVAIRNLPSSVILGTWSGGSPRKRGDFDLAEYASSPGIDPHSHVNQRFHCMNIPQESNRGVGANDNRFCNAEVDRLIDEAGLTVDQEKRKELYARIQKIINDNVVNIWLYNNNRIDAFRANVGGYRGNSWDTVTWTVADWYVRR